MFSFGKYLAMAAIASLASAQTAEDRAAWPIIADMMDHWSATWEPVTVVNDDGYHLTMIHITGTSQGPVEVSKPPLLVVHGMLTNCESWIDPAIHKRTDPIVIKFADAGYDVYLGNVRGTRYG
jgi:pimeloyl-ACP methyl ester carboxylesterase